MRLSDLIPVLVAVLLVYFWLLAGRAMACVQAYLTALQPAPTAYDRRGGRPGASRAGTTWGKV